MAKKAATQVIANYQRKKPLLMHVRIYVLIMMHLAPDKKAIRLLNNAPHSISVLSGIGAMSQNHSAFNIMPARRLHDEMPTEDGASQQAD